MKHLELHILQSFPVACLNRDDLNSPKTAIFGGVQRARVSSQSWKRAIRELAQDELLPGRFKGERTRYIIEPLIEAFKGLGKNQEEATKAGQELAAALATKDTDARTKTLFYSTPGELVEFASAYLSATNKAAAKKAIETLIKKAPHDAADIALFGRMVASDFTAKLEGAAMFSHALSTHKVDNEIDFFAAVDDNQPEDQAGAGMTSTLEFNSVAVNAAGIAAHVCTAGDTVFKFQNHIHPNLSTTKTFFILRENTTQFHNFSGKILQIIYSV